jgi:hypothetical protein
MRFAAGRIAKTESRVEPMRRVVFQRNTQPHAASALMRVRYQRAEQLAAESSALQVRDELNLFDVHRILRYVQLDHADGVPIQFDDLDIAAR